MSDHFRSKIDDVLSRTIDIRHELHANPELGHNEHATAGRIVAWLEQIGGLDIRTGLAKGTGVMATLQTGRPGPVIAFRADIDALPIQEQGDLPYASQTPGQMHACGHDGHTAILLGVAAVLASLRGQLAGTIKFIFQPAEESGRGGEATVNDGVLENPQVEAIFGLHGWPALKVGQVATRPGPLMASTDSFYVTVHGQGGHGAHPHLSHDPIVAASHIVVALQTVVARTLDPLKSGVVTVGKLHAGTAINIIPSSAELAGTIRALDPQVREHLRNQVEQIIRHTAAAHGCRAEINMPSGYPVTVNDERMAALVSAVARDVVGEANFVANRPPSMGGEDFSFYLQRVPGCYFFVGTCPIDRDDYPSIHTPTYDFSDGALAVGMRMFCELARRCSEGALSR